MNAGRTSGFFEPAALRRFFGMFIGRLLVSPADGVVWGLAVGTFMIAETKESSNLGQMICTSPNFLSDMILIMHRD